MSITHHQNQHDRDRNVFHGQRTWYLFSCCILGIFSFFPFPTISFCFIYFLVAKQVLFLLKYLSICLISKLFPTRITILVGPVHAWKLYLRFPTNQKVVIWWEIFQGGKAENGVRMNNVISCLEKTFLGAQLP